MDKPSRRVLLIEMCFYGDMLLTTPVISLLKKNHLDVEIDVLPYQGTTLILSESPEINALCGIKNRKAKASEKTVNFFYLIKVLRANKYDLVTNLTDQWMAATLARLLSARMKISQDYHHQQSAFWRNSFVHLVPSQGGNVVESNLSVLTPLGLEPLVKQMTMSYLSASWKRTRHELDHTGVGQNYVVTQPTAWQIPRCRDNAKLFTVVDALHTHGYEVVLTSGPDKDDLAYVNEIIQRCQTPPVAALARRVIFPELGALIDHAQLSIGVDSAPTRIAAAVNAPLVPLFGATDHIF